MSTTGAPEAVHTSGALLLLGHSRTRPYVLGQAEGRPLRGGGETGPDQRASSYSLVTASRQGVPGRVRREGVG